MSFWRRKTDELLCPDFKAPCLKSQCIAWTHVVGLDPNGKEVDLWDCSKYHWDHKMTMQIAQKINQLAACVESERNVIHSDLITMIQTVGGGLLELAKRSISEPTGQPRTAISMVTEPGSRHEIGVERTRLLDRNGSSGSSEHSSEHER